MRCPVSSVYYFRMKNYPTIEDTIGSTPQVRLQRITGQVGQRRGNVLMAKLARNNPAGSVKDRASSSMILRAQEACEIRTTKGVGEGNSGIVLVELGVSRHHEQKKKKIK